MSRLIERARKISVVAGFIESIGEKKEIKGLKLEILEKKQKLHDLLLLNEIGTCALHNLYQVAFRFFAEDGSLLINYDHTDKAPAHIWSDFLSITVFPNGSVWKDDGSLAVKPTKDLKDFKQVSKILDKIDEGVREKYKITD